MSMISLPHRAGNPAGGASQANGEQSTASMAVAKGVTTSFDLRCVPCAVKGVECVIKLAPGLSLPRPSNLGSPIPPCQRCEDESHFIGCGHWQIRRDSPFMTFYNARFLQALDETESGKPVIIVFEIPGKPGVDGAKGSPIDGNTAGRSGATIPKAVDPRLKPPTPAASNTAQGGVVVPASSKRPTDESPSRSTPDANNRHGTHNVPPPTPPQTPALPSSSSPMSLISSRDSASPTKRTTPVPEDVGGAASATLVTSDIARSDPAPAVAATTTVANATGRELTPREPVTIAAVSASQLPQTAIVGTVGVTETPSAASASTVHSPDITEPLDGSIEAVIKRISELRPKQEMDAEDTALLRVFGFSVVKVDGEVYFHHMSTRCDLCLKNGQERCRFTRLRYCPYGPERGWAHGSIYANECKTWSDPTALLKEYAVKIASDTVHCHVDSVSLAKVSRTAARDIEAFGENGGKGPMGRLGPLRKPLYVPAESSKSQATRWVYRGLGRGKRAASPESATSSSSAPITKRPRPSPSPPSRPSTTCDIASDLPAASASSRSPPESSSNITASAAGRGARPSPIPTGNHASPPPSLTRGISRDGNLDPPSSPAPSSPPRQSSSDSSSNGDAAPGPLHQAPSVEAPSRYHNLANQLIEAIKDDVIAEQELLRTESIASLEHDRAKLVSELTAKIETLEEAARKSEIEIGTLKDVARKELAKAVERARETKAIPDDRDEKARILDNVRAQFKTLEDGIQALKTDAEKNAAECRRQEGLRKDAEKERDSWKRAYEDMKVEKELEELETSRQRSETDGLKLRIQAIELECQREQNKTKLAEIHCQAERKKSEIAQRKFQDRSQASSTPSSAAAT